jgi:phage gpG-like protein
MFYLNITLDGDEKLSRILLNEENKLKDFTEPLRKSSDVVLKDIRINFDTEGGLVGGWTPLAQATIRGRIRKGYGAAPILVNTEKYKNSFRALVNTDKAVIDAWGISYHKYHQSMSPRTKLPRRQTLFLREETKREIVRFFQTYMEFNK